MDLKDRRIVVTGGSMGLGWACARACLEAGARVRIAARHEEPLRRAAQELGPRCSWQRADVSCQDQVKALLEGAQQELGGLEGVVHCAAVQGPIGPLSDTDPEAWLEALRINLFGSFLVARQACQLMAASGGSLVLFSGGGATTPFPCYSAYASSKAGVVRLAESLAQEVASQGIRVNAVAPGFVATRLHQDTLAAGERAGAHLEHARRLLQAGAVPPELGARAAVFLLSDRSRGITGKLLAAPWDDWESWPEHLEQLRDSDLFTLRRILPRDRGQDWQ